MSDMSKPEMTAQVLVAVGAVFLLISAYVMGVYIPNQKELDDDFESRTSFDGDMTLFDATKSATLQGDFNAENALNSYAAKDGTNAEIVATADPSKSDDEKTYYNFNASAFSSQEKTEENRILTFSDYNNYVDRTTWETKSADDPDAKFGYSLWNPNELPEKKDTKYPNPFVSTHTNNYIYAGEETVGGIDCYKYTADETFAYSSASVLALKANFDGFLPEGVEGTSAGEMHYKEVIWVGKETGQVADRALDISVYFIPDPRLAINFQATEALDSTIQYEGTLDELDITADRRTFSSGSVFAGVDNATGAERTYMNATGTLFVSGETEPRVNTTFLIDTHTQQAQGQAPDGTYISGGSTFFSIGSVCENSTVDNHTTYQFQNLFLDTHVNTYECIDPTAIPGFIIPSAQIMGTTNAYHYRSTEMNVPFGNLDADGDGIDDTPSLPVFDPANGFCMNPGLCPDRQWAPLIAFALTQTALGDSALAIPIKAEGNMTLPRFTDNASMVVNQEAIFGSQYHPLIQMSFTGIDEYAAALGLENVSYMNMPFVLDPEGSRNLPVPGDASCDMGVTCVMGSDFTHPLVAGVMNATMTQLSGNGDAYKEMPWYIGESTVLPVPGDLACLQNQVCTLGSALHPLVREQLATTAAYGLDPVNTPWVTTNPENGEPIVMKLPNMTEDFSAYYYMQADMSYGLDLNTALLGNQTDGNPLTWAPDMNGFCNLDLRNQATGVCVPMNEYVNYSAPMMLESVMPSITAAQLPLFDVAADLPVIQPQTLSLSMDYVENVWLDPITATVLDQDFTILVNVTFPWGTKAPAQSIIVEYTEAQKLASSGSRWTAEFAYTFLPGSPLRADNANFTIMTLQGGYSDSEKSDAKTTIEDTSSALSSARTIPTVLIGVALASLIGGFYVYYQNNEGMGLGMDDMSSPSEEPESSMATVTEEDSEEDSEDSSEEE